MAVVTSCENQELLLQIRSAHLKILGFPIDDAYQYRDIFTRFKIMQRK